MNKKMRSILIEYMRSVKPTDTMPPELQPVLFGLFGEVGSVMAASKKFYRERKVYGNENFRKATVDEFGDVLWYLAAICRRLQLNIYKIFEEALSDVIIAVPNTLISSRSLVLQGAKKPTTKLDLALCRLGEAAAALLLISKGRGDAIYLIKSFATCYIHAIAISGIRFEEIAAHNSRKTVGRFVETTSSVLPKFDDGFGEEERIPQNFEIKISQRKTGKSYLQWKGVFIGDPLADNIRDPDGYRFHDVFHLANAAVLHWSPVFRALIKHKRKSKPDIEEAQDSGRAIVIEEGLTAWIFSRAKEVNFSWMDSVPFDLLKEIEKFIAGYEVADCPLKQWERSILQGYKAFLLVRQNKGGILIGDRKSRTLVYKPLTGA